jgi:hypothetical protein
VKLTSSLSLITSKVYFRVQNVQPKPKPGAKLAKKVLTRFRTKLKLKLKQQKNLKTDVALLKGRNMIAK